MQAREEKQRERPKTTNVVKRAVKALGSSVDIEPLSQG
jgi:hypothetical protein